MRSEDKIQQECVMWFRNTYSRMNLPHNPYLIFSVPNDGKNVKEQMRKIATGLLSGVSDLIVVSPNNVHFIEIKDDKGKQSKSQEKFEDQVKSLGFKYNICRNLLEFKNILLYLQRESC